MSRGPGKKQRDICDLLAANPAPTTFETLRWALFEQGHADASSSPDDSPGRLRDGKMPGSWNSSLTRALERLAEGGERRVIIRRRRLASMDEFVRHYPGKSLVVKTRKLRIDLLPGLAKIAQGPEHQARYTQAENEQWFVTNRLGDKLAQFQKDWDAIEPELVEQLPRLAGEDRDHLFYLIARAKSLFRSAPLECRRSIAQCLAPLAEHDALPPATLKKTADFSNALLPPARIGFLRLKSQIRSFADIPATGSGYRLKAETLDGLEEACPEVVRSLPGYKPPPPRRQRGGKFTSFDSIFTDGPRSTHGPDIHKLIDKTAFERFVFVRLA